MRPLTHILLLLTPLIAHASFLGRDHRSLARRDHSQLVNRTKAHSPEKHCKSRMNKIAASFPASSETGASVLVTDSKGNSRSKSGPNDKDRMSAPFNTKGSPGLENNAGSNTDTKDSKCGNKGATKEPTIDSGPNGSEEWLNCGINDDGWHPPHMNIGDLVFRGLEGAVGQPDSPFRACRPFLHNFEEHGKRFGLPPILIASLALQESSCNPEVVGQGGEQGLMQITREKCVGAPGGNCKDTDFNIKIGTAFLAHTLNSTNGNVIEAIGKYNGWYKGMTYEDATAAASGPCCRCQNNLDYVQHIINHWLQNSEPHGGVYNNLAKCSN